MNSENSFDLAIFGSGFSSRHLIEMVLNQKKDARILIINPKKLYFSKFGLSHKHGNLFIQHNIRAEEKDLKKIQLLKEKQFISINLQTYRGKLPKKNYKSPNIKFFNIENNSHIYINKRKSIFNMELKNKRSSIFIKANCIIFACSWGCKNLFKNIFYENLKFEELVLKDKSDSLDNYSTIFKISDVRAKLINIPNSNSNIKLATLCKFNNDDYFHFYLKKFRFKYFKDEWNATIAITLIKKGYIYELIKLLFHKPIIIADLFLRFILPKYTGVYITVESKEELLCSKSEEIYRILVKKLSLSNKEKKNLKFSLKSFTSNSHFHSFYKKNPMPGVFIIGSSSIGKTYSINPTAIILKQLKDVFKEVNKYL